MTAYPMVGWLPGAHHKPTFSWVSLLWGYAAPNNRPYFFHHFPFPPSLELFLGSGSPFHQEGGECGVVTPL